MYWMIAIGIVCFTILTIVKLFFNHERTLTQQTADNQLTELIQRGKNDKITKFMELATVLANGYSGRTDFYTNYLDDDDKKRYAKIMQEYAEQVLKERQNG